MKKILCVILLIIISLSIVGCEKKQSDNSNLENAESEKILLAAAASLKNCIDGELIPMFKEKNKNITIETTYDSSGKLQSQIEEGADVDVFISAAMKQMNDLNSKGFIKTDSIVELLENKIVLIVPSESKLDILNFEDILKAESIAIGDPESVPAGQYAKECLNNLGIWDEVNSKASLGTNVTEVLNWVAEGSADVGIVYSTDANSNDKVKIIDSAPEESVSKVIYPIGIVNTTTKEESAELFAKFLCSDEAIAIFEKYGFSSAK